MSQPTQQALLNSLACLLIETRDINQAWPEQMDEESNIIIGEVLGMGDISTLVNAYKGINWGASDGNYVTDIDTLIESADEQVDVFTHFAILETRAIHAMESFSESKHTYHDAQAGSLEKELKSITIEPRKVILAKEYAALGVEIIERKLAVRVNNFLTTNYATSMFDGDPLLGTCVDVRVDPHSDSSHTVTFYFPNDETIFDELKSRLLSEMSRLEGAKIKLHPIECISACIPGNKDVIDYKNATKVKARMVAEQSNEAPSP